MIERKTQVGSTCKPHGLPSNHGIPVARHECLVHSSGKVRDVPEKLAFRYKNVLTLTL